MAGSAKSERLEVMAVWQEGHQDWYWSQVVRQPAWSFGEQDQWEKEWKRKKRCVQRCEQGKRQRAFIVLVPLGAVASPPSNAGEFDPESEGELYPLPPTPPPPATISSSSIPSKQIVQTQSSSKSSPLSFRPPSAAASVSGNSSNTILRHSTVLLILSLVLPMAINLPRIERRRI